MWQTCVRVWSYCMLSLCDVWQSCVPVWVCVKLLYVKFVCVCVKLVYVSVFVWVCVWSYCMLSCMCDKVACMSVCVKLLYVEFVCVCEVSVCDRWYVANLCVWSYCILSLCDVKLWYVWLSCVCECVLNYCMLVYVRDGMWQTCVCECVFICCMLSVWAGGGRRRRRRPGIQNQKQEPHTKLWGTTPDSKSVIWTVLGPSSGIEKNSELCWRGTTWALRSLILYSWARPSPSSWHHRFLSRWSSWSGPRTVGPWPVAPVTSPCVPSVPWPVIRHSHQWRLQSRPSNPLLRVTFSHSVHHFTILT